MFMIFLSTSQPRAPDKMSTREDAEKVVVGAVVRRRSEEVVEEMAEIAKGERTRMAAQAAQALPKTLRLRETNWSDRRPIKGRPVNPVPPPSPEQLRIAAVRRREHAEEERRFLDNGARIFGHPRTPTPPRAGEDPYGFAKWAQRRY